MPSTSSGRDGISAKMLLLTKHISRIILTYIFSLSLQEGVFPISWKIGRVVSIFKAGSNLFASSYHPISLASVHCKIF